MHLMEWLAGWPGASAASRPASDCGAGTGLPSSSALARTLRDVGVMAAVFRPRMIPTAGVLPRRTAFPASIIVIIDCTLRELRRIGNVGNIFRHESDVDASGKSGCGKPVHV